MPPELDAEMLATLTPEERAAIEDDKPSDEELAAMQKIAAGAPADEDDDNDDDDGEGTGTPPVEGKPAASAPASAEPAAPATPAAAIEDDKPANAELSATAPAYDAKLPEDFDAKVQGLTEQEQAAWAKFDEGEIDRAELQKQLRGIEQERADLNTARIKAEISQEMTAQTAQQQWANSVNRFMSTAAKEEGGIDYRKDEAKAADLDQFVKILAGNQANADKPMDWFLAEAHKRVQALHGVAPAAPKQSVADAVARRKPPVSDVPATLAQVPGGEGPGDVAGEFADLDALEGNDLEAAIAKMSPAQRERFARA